MTTILIVEDEKRIASFVAKGLRAAGFVPEVYSTGAEAVEAALQGRGALMLLDVGLPDIDGFEVLEQIRGQGVEMPVIMLTARTSVSDRVAGLEGGADDYVPKPFKPKELVARVRARLRGREDSQVDEGLTLQDLAIDVAGHIVKREGRVIALTPLEFDLLVTLARSPWKVFSREELLEQVWGYRHAADTRLVNVHVQRLRSKIERDPERPELVVTVRGVGYRAGAGA